MKPYTCPPQLSDVATLHWEIQKRHLSTLLFIYFRLFTLAQKKTSSNCCSAALSVYLLLFSASYYRHSPIALRLGHATGGARVLIWTCCGFRQQLVVTWAEFQHSVVYYATERRRRSLEAYINAEGGHFEHFLWHCLPDIPTAIHHDGFISESLTTTHNWLSNVWKNATNLQLDEKVSKFTS